MMGHSFVVDACKHVIDIVVYYSYSVKTFFCGRRAEFVVVGKVYSLWIKATEGSIGREFVGSGSCTIIGKFRQR